MTISRRDFVKAAAAGPLLGRLPVLEAAQGRRLNLLWIMTDQHPLGGVGAYGNPVIKTPNLDRIASEGAKFDRFYISAFPCSPSRACLLTGREAHNHGVVKNDIMLGPDVPALGDILKSAGYATGYVGKWHLGGNMYPGHGRREQFDGRWVYERVPDPQGFQFKTSPGGKGEDAPQHGFDYWFGGWQQYHDYLRSVGLNEIADKKLAGNHNDMPSGPEGTHIYSKLSQEHHMASFFARRSVEFLERQKGSDRPFALVLSFYGPHLPVAPPKPWDEMYPLEKVALPSNHRDELKGKPVRQRTNDRCYKLPEWKDEQFRDYIRRYWGYCSYIDHQIGRVLEVLDKTERANDTIVLFTTDHGDMVGAHGFIFKLCWCGYDELLHVPFLLRCPGLIRPGSTYDSLVSAIDVLPTLLDMMGVKTPPGVDGRSFLPVVRGTAKSHREVVLCNSSENNLTVADKRWKYVLNWNPRDLDELYDLQADPGEMRNLASDKAHAGTVEQMRARLKVWLEGTKYPYRQTVLAAMVKEPEQRVCDLWPEVKAFNYIGGNEFEYSYVWHCADEPPKDLNYWSFTHFVSRKSGRDGEIAFRDTRWPKPPTTAWKKGEDYSVGPVRVRIPDHAGPGEYKVRIGLYNPQKKASPGQLLRGQGNAFEVGRLFIEKRAGQVTKAAFAPAKRP
jgi:arylsulfatase